MPTEKAKPLYEGKAKQLFAGPGQGQYVLHFKDSATAFNNKKKAEIEDKGIFNLKISARIFEYLAGRGIASHYIQTVGERDMLVKAVTIIPIEVVVRNISAGSICKRLGLEEKMEIYPPLVEFFYKNDDLDDPLITEDHIALLRLASREEIVELRTKAIQINDALRDYFQKIDIVLVDFKIEFGRDEEGRVLLADEITPDGCRLWDAKTMDILDKDRFRRDLGGMREAYEEVLKRIEQRRA